MGIIFRNGVPYSGSSNRATAIDYDNSISNLKAKDTQSAIDENNIKIVAAKNTLGYKCINLIPYPFTSTSITKNGLEFIDNSDGTISVKGTATDDTSFVLFDIEKQICIVAGTYTLSGCPNKEGCNISIGRNNDGVYELIGEDIGEDFTFYNDESSLPFKIELNIKSGTILNNVTFKPQLEVGLVASPFTSYEPKVKESIESLSKKINIFDNRLSGLSFQPISKSEYESLEDKEDNILYLVYEDQ